MAKWDWLEKAENVHTWGLFVRVIVKAVVLFALLNVLFAAARPLDSIGRLTMHNTVVPGRERLPYADDPTVDYSISTFNIPAMLATHTINRPKAADEFRVILIGDSATWGWFLESPDTISGQLNALDTASHTLADGRKLVFYNLGYPVMSLLKDVLILEEAMLYAPDMIIWPVTLESFPRDKQVFPPLVQNNAERARELIEAYNLDLDADDPRFVERDFVGETLLERRRELADWLRLQLYGFTWASTEIDQFIPAEYDLRANDFAEDLSWESGGFDAPTPLDETVLAFDVLHAGITLAGDIPILLVNEPIFISDGENSDLRYNSFYPRWAYDAYRESLTEAAEAENWPLLDLWDALPPEVFTDTPVHTTPTGSTTTANLLLPVILELADQSLAG